MQPDAQIEVRQPTLSSSVFKLGEWLLGTELWGHDNGELWAGELWGRQALGTASFGDGKLWGRQALGTHKTASFGDTQNELSQNEL
jgi:hypothetical protein